MLEIDEVSCVCWFWLFLIFVPIRPKVTRKKKQYYCHLDRESDTSDFLLSKEDACAMMLIPMIDLPVLTAGQHDHAPYPNL